MGCIVSTILVQFCYFWERNSQHSHKKMGIAQPHVPTSWNLWGQRLSPVPQQISDRNGGRRSSPKGQHLDGDNIGNCTNQSISLMFVLIPSNITNCKVTANICSSLLIHISALKVKYSHQKPGWSYNKQFGQSLPCCWPGKPCYSWHFNGFYGFLIWTNCSPLHILHKARAVRKLKMN